MPENEQIGQVAQLKRDHGEGLNAMKPEHGEEFKAMKPERGEGLIAVVARIKAFEEAKLKAVEAAAARWVEEGGAGSALGLPLSQNLEPRIEGDSAFFEFRGGSIDVADLQNLAVMTTSIKKKAELWFVGLECLHRQEDHDEISVSVGTLNPSSLKVDAHYSYFENIGDATERMRTAAVPIYSGPPASLVIAVSAVERDSGNKANELEAGLKGALDKAGSELMDAVPGVGAVAAIARENLGFDPSVIGGLWDDLKDWFVGLFGLPDDDLGSAVLAIHADEAPLVQTATHSPDPRKIDYTHKVNIKNGAEELNYNFYFRYVVSDV